MAEDPSPARDLDEGSWVGAQFLPDCLGAVPDGAGGLEDAGDVFGEEGGWGEGEDSGDAFSQRGVDRWGYGCPGEGLLALLVAFGNFQ